MLVAAAIAVAGCGGDDGGGGAGDPAALAPADSPVFVSGTIRPEGELKSNVEGLVENLAGISDPGERIVGELDKALAEDSDLTYEDDIEPWLGESGGIFLERYDGEDFHGVGFIVQTTDGDAARQFVDDAVEQSGEQLREGSYEGVDYRFDDEAAAGIVDDFLVFTDGEQTFKEVVDTSGGDGLDGNDQYTETTGSAPEGSLADVYVNVGALIEQSGAAVDQQVLGFYESLGYDISNGTAVVSLVPRSDQVELDASTNVGSGDFPTGDVSDFLGELPADAFAAFATPDVGERIGQVIDVFDKMGIPGEVPPGTLRSTLRRAGVDLDQIVGAIGDVGVFAQGTDLASLGGAVVVSTSDEAAARDTVASIGRLLRRSDAPGLTVVTGNAVGFAFRSPELGPKPLVVLASGERIAIGYGKEPTEQAVSASGETLSGSEAFDAASGSLGGADLAGFVDFEPIVELANALGASTDTDFAVAKPYLDKLDFLAIGSGKEGDLVTSKVVLALKGD
jgi:hypothetical protein